jgi:hypothetical protein
MSSPFVVHRQDPGQAKDYLQTVTGAVDRVLQLWTEPLPPGETAVHAFREAYADSVIINEVVMFVTDPCRAGESHHKRRWPQRAALDTQIGR